jgi:hypothetical protein
MFAFRTEEGTKLDGSFGEGFGAGFGEINGLVVVAVVPLIYVHNKSYW